MKKSEQICPNESPGYKKECKKKMVRSERRAAKSDPEEAPKKRSYRGYTS